MVEGVQISAPLGRYAAALVVPARWFVLVVIGIAITSLLLAEGVDIATVSARLGHSSVRTTADIYSHAIRGKDHAAVSVGIVDGLVADLDDLEAPEVDHRGRERQMTRRFIDRGAYAPGVALGLTLPVARVIVNQAHCFATGGSYDNARTGTTGNINAGKQYNAWTGNAWASKVGTSYNSVTGRESAGQRAGVENVYTGNYAYGQRGAGNLRRPFFWLRRPAARPTRAAPGRPAGPLPPQASSPAPSSLIPPSCFATSLPAISTAMVKIASSAEQQVRGMEEPGVFGLVALAFAELGQERLPDALPLPSPPSSSVP